MPEFGLALVADRALERDRRLRRAHDPLDLVDVEIDVRRDVGWCRVAAQLAAQPPVRRIDSVEPLDDVHRDADRPGLVRETPRNGLADPPRRVGRELEALAVVKLL